MKIRRMLKVSGAVLHHTASNKAFRTAVKSADENHKNRLHTGKGLRTGINGNGYYVAYHWMIGEKEGEILNTRPEWEIGYHSGAWMTNLTHLGVAIVGNFSTKPLSEGHLNNLKIVMSGIQQRHGLFDDVIKFHRDIKATQCPGNMVNKEEVFAYIFSKNISEWAKDSVEKAIIKKIATKWDNPQEIVGNQTLGYILKNMGVLKKIGEAGITKEQFIVALDRLGKLD